MAQRPGQVEFLRLKNMLLKDKVSAPAYLTSVIKSDVYAVLKDYMEITPDTLDVNITAKEDGFHIKINAKTLRFKPLGALPKEI